MQVSNKEGQGKVLQTNILNNFGLDNLSRKFHTFKVMGRTECTKRHVLAWQVLTNMAFAGRTFAVTGGASGLGRCAVLLRRIRLFFERVVYFSGPR